MTIVHTLQHYMNMLPFFAIPILAVTILAVQLQDHERGDWVPYGFVVVYVGTCVVLYVTSGIHRFLAFDFPRWMSMLITLWTGAAFPLLAAVFAIAWFRRKNATTRQRIMAGIGGGVLFTPLVTVTGEVLFGLLRPWYANGGM